MEVYDLQSLPLFSLQPGDDNTDRAATI